ncbi:MAG: peroxidase family protein [Planctomycetota bacterium]
MVTREPRSGKNTHSASRAPVALAALVCTAGLAIAEPPENASPIHRPAREAKLNHDAKKHQASRITSTAPAEFPLEFRTIDGQNNNGANQLWGAAGIPFIRLVPVDYTDGIGSPGGTGRASARVVSNEVHAQVGNMPNHAGRSDYLWQWGQFLDHDITETPASSPAEAFNIEVPYGDPWFDAQGTGEAIIPLTRSAAATGVTPREQLNNITAFIDASNVYGSDHERAEALRTHDGNGTLKTSAGDLMPFNTAMLENAPAAYDPSFFLGGDVRANEQAGLAAIHTLFVREHNRLAAIIRAEHPTMTGDEIYEHARAFVAAEMQAITYNEFLPALLGPNALPPYSGYKPGVDPSISNTFATAAYRVGHTMLSTQIMRVDSNGNEITAGHLSLADAFFTPSLLIDHGIDSILRGLAFQRAQTIDRHVVDDVRNFLFGMPGDGGFDLAALNIQRGREHGLGSYNDVRVAFGRPAATSFYEIAEESATMAALAAAYETPDDIDAWTGLLSEPHRPKALVGETLFRVLRDEFVRLRDGDRFWYEAYLPAEMVDQVNALRLSDIIQLNTGIGAEIQDNVFLAPDFCRADITTTGASLPSLGYWVPDGQADLDDLGCYINGWLVQDPATDMTHGTLPGNPGYGEPNGHVDFDDLGYFLHLWLANCP